MKYLSLILLTLMACNKVPLPVPTSGPVSIHLLTAEIYGQGVVIRFRAVNTQDVVYYKIFSGDNGNLLCVTAEIKNDPSQTDYSFKDLHPTGNPTYYMLAYVKRDSSLRFDKNLIKINHP